MGTELNGDKLVKLAGDTINTIHILSIPDEKNDKNFDKMQVKLFLNLYKYTI